MIAQVGDYVKYKLSPSGVPGTCLITEEGHSKERGTPMFFGHAEGRAGVVHLYPEDIVEVLSEPDGPFAVGPVRCTACGHQWIALRSAQVVMLECPECAEIAKPEEER